MYAYKVCFDSLSFHKIFVANSISQVLMHIKNNEKDILYWQVQSIDRICEVDIIIDETTG